LCLRALALALGQLLLLLDDLGLFDPDLVCDQFALAGRIAAELYAQLRFFELQPNGSQRIARPGTQRHFAVLSPEAVAVAKVNTDTFLPGVHLVRCLMKLSTDSVRKAVDKSHPVINSHAAQGFPGDVWGKFLSPRALKHPFPHVSPHAAVRENLRPPQRDCPTY
jgi:hypothetical protein